MKTGDLAVELRQNIVLDIVWIPLLEGRNVGPPRDDDGVLLRPQPDGKDVGNAYVGTGRQQRRDCFVLNLLEASDRSTPWGVAVEEEAPAARQPLRVLRVAAEDLHVHLGSALVVSLELRRSDVLPGGKAEVLELDSECRYGGVRPIERRHAKGRSEDEPDKCSHAETERKAAKHA